MALSKEEILQGIEEMNVMEVVGLVEAMEEKFGVSAANLAPAAAAPVGSAADAEDVKTSFDVVITASGDKKIAVIKVVRALTGLGLKEAKEKVDSAPTAIKEGVNKEEAQDLQKQLEEAELKIKNLTKNSKSD